jgi:hypothetical protein
LDSFSEHNAIVLIDLVHEARSLAQSVAEDQRDVCLNNLNQTIDKQIWSYDNAKKSRKASEYDSILRNFREDLRQCADVLGLEENKGDENN